MAAPRLRRCRICRPALAILAIAVCVLVSVNLSTLCTDCALWLLWSAPRGVARCSLLHRPLVLLQSVSESAATFRFVVQSRCDAQTLRASVSCADSRLVLFEALDDAAVATLTFETRADVRVVQCVALGGAFEFALRWPDDRPVHALVLSDAQANPGVFRRLLRNSRLAALDLVLFGGDATQHSRAFEWARYAAAYEELAALVPIAHARGNHDHGLEATLFGSPAPLVAFSFGAARVLVLDSSFFTHPHLHAPTTRAELHAALDAELVGGAWLNASWRVAACHVPRRIGFWEPAAWARGEKLEPEAIDAQLWPRLRDARVDVLISGHSHMYSYATSADSGAAEFIVGGAGGALEVESERVAAPFAEKELLVHHSATLSVSKQRLVWTVHDESDRVIHQVEKLRDQ
jgi:predicted phosphodiesterase